MCLWVCVDIPEHPVELQSYQDYQDQGSIELFHMAIFTVETICDNGIYCCLKTSIEPTWIKENSSQESIWHEDGNREDLEITTILTFTL